VHGFFEVDGVQNFDLIPLAEQQRSTLHNHAALREILSRA
jgi:hypothetical protein